MRGASYYDVVIRRGRRKVLELRPSTNTVRLPMTWSHDGVRGSLSAGRYVWFARPGFGSRASGRYGKPAQKGILIVNALAWAPPALLRPITVPVSDAGQTCPSLANQNPDQPWSCVLDPSRDYILKLGHRTDAGGLVVVGGHNVVIIGGEITPTVDATSWHGRGLTFWNQTGTVHIEGVWIESPGDGILIDAPQATFQIENVRIDNVHAAQDSFSINHPDILQTWNGPAVARIDHLTGSSDYQGFFWSRDDTRANTVYPGRVTQMNVNLDDQNPQPKSVMALPSLHDVFTYEGASTVSSCWNCWMLTGYNPAGYRRKLQDSYGAYKNAADTFTTVPYKVIGHAGQIRTTPADDDVGRRQGDQIRFPTTPNMRNEVWSFGTPAGGDFVPNGLAGTNYVSPGYTLHRR